MTITRRRFVEHSAFAAAALAAAPQSFARDSKHLPWHNWSGALTSAPRARVAPASVDELLAWLKSSTGKLRPVGAGHSFSPLVPTDGALLVLDRLSGLQGHDAATLRATFGAGTRIADIGAPLEEAGQAMQNIADIDRQTLAGAIATSTHGTGRDIGSLSSFVTKISLATLSGDLITADAEHYPEVFAAARTNLGVLGIVIAIELQNRAPYRLERKTWAASVEDTLATFDDEAAQHRHFEMFPLVHSDYAVVMATDETDAPAQPNVADPADETAFDGFLRGAAKLPVAARRAAFAVAARAFGPTEVVDASYRVLANVRNARFNEMEYSVPRDAGAACLREILQTIESQSIDIAFPLEYRYVKGDDVWLSMFSGRDSVSISVHNFWDVDYRPYFAVIEPIFWKYEGRPHWGKVHTLTSARLERLYPHWRDFLGVRADFDPEQRLLNDHLRAVFGFA